jgi:hypothetical protein
MTAADCIAFGQCYTVGPGSSVVLNNGAILPEVATAVWEAGGRANAAFVLIVAMIAVGVGVICIATSRFLRPALAVPASVIALAFLQSQTLASPLIDTSLTFLPSAGTAAALLVFALTDRPFAIVVAAVFAAHAADSHVSGVCLLPALVLVAALAGRRSLILAGTSLIVAGALTSLQTMIQNVLATARLGVLPLALIGLVALAIVGLRFHARYQGLRPAWKAAVVAGALLAPYGIGVLELLHLGHPLLGGYLPIVVTPLAMIATVLLAWPATRLPSESLRHWATPLAPFAIGLLGLAVPPSQNAGAIAVPPIWSTPKGPRP